MNALSLYVTTTRMLFQADIDDSGAWNDINRLMSYLRQSLTCCVCGNLLYIPMSSTVSSCQHHVCKSCVGGKMRLKPSCSWCKDHSKFIENIQLRILLQCYKQLASFILSSSIIDNWGYLACEANQTPYSSVPTTFNGPATFRQLLEEGSNFHDKYTFSEPPPIRSLHRQTNGHNNHHNYNLQLPAQLNTYNNNHHQANSLLTTPSNSQMFSDGETSTMSTVKTVASFNSNNILNSSVNVNGSINNRINDNNGNTSNTNRIITNIGSSINIVGNLVPSITLGEAINGENTKTGIILKTSSAQAITFNRNIIKADTAQINKILTGSLSSSLNSPLNSSCSSGNNQIPNNRKVRRGCRCGLATPNPGKLTCCGQRCPCYVESKACNQCKCRGCRNPNKISGLTTINIISSGSSAMVSTVSSPSTLTSTSLSNVSTSTTTPLTSNSLATTSLPITPTISKSTESSIISIPASNLFQIPIIVNSDGLVKEVGDKQVLMTTASITGKSFLDDVKSNNQFTLDS